MVAEPVFDIMEARWVVLEKRLKRTEEVLVMDRLAQRFAESAQQMVGTQPAGIEKYPLERRVLSARRKLVEPQTSSGESGLSSQAEGMALQMWSLILSELS